MRPSFGLPPDEFCLGVEPEKGGELPWASEAGRILNGRRHRRGGDRSEAGNAHQPAGRFVLLRQLGDDAVEPRYRFVEVAQLPTTAQTDHMLRAEIVGRLAEQQWTDFGERNVIVVNGIANLWGLVGSPSERKALTFLVEGVPGVTEVRDEMIPAYQ